MERSSQKEESVGEDRRGKVVPASPVRVKRSPGEKREHSIGIAHGPGKQ